MNVWKTLLAVALAGSFAAPLAAHSEVVSFSSPMRCNASAESGPRYAPWAQTVPLSINPYRGKLLGRC